MSSSNFSKHFLFVFLFCVIFLSDLKAQHSIYEPLDINEVNFSFQDFGTMWTFDDVPEDYFLKTYGFVPTSEWLDSVRLSALQFGGGCSAAFVSNDGLIMTNHHCGRGALKDVQEEGEDLLRDGFYAATLNDERPMPNHFVDQLIEIKDVTERVFDAMNKSSDDQEKIDLKDSVIAAIEADCTEETGLKCRVVTLYNGGKYSLYIYKRYTDIRLVMVPDFQIAATGWDWDNFTYPRYELDFAFYRAYDDSGKPVKSDHYFKWSKKGAQENEAIFVVGRPGNTDRLYSVIQLEYLRDVVYPYTLIRYNEMYNANFAYFKNHPERESELLHRVLSTGNGRKSFAGGLMGLNDEYLMAKKMDFENNLKAKVAADPELNEKYGHIWNAIKKVIDELRVDADKAYAYSLNRWSLPTNFKIAQSVIEYANQMQLTEDEREYRYKKENLPATIEEILHSESDPEMDTLMIRAHANFITKLLGRSNELVLKTYGGMEGKKAVEFALQKSSFSDTTYLRELLSKKPEYILDCGDPFINYLVKTQDDLEAINKHRAEAQNTLDVLNQELGRLIFETYGNNIPPDATSTLRISDGVIKGYEYNGTIAPGKVTFYGLWDRYNSFGKNTYPWGLHERWKTPPAELDLSIPVGFASTNDIVGGNSGSSIINKKLEVVGLVHDGNLESLAGSFAFLPENNRAVATDSWGLMEALKYIYKTQRLAKELQTGSMDNN